MEMVTQDRGNNINKPIFEELMTTLVKTSEQLGEIWNNNNFLGTSKPATPFRCTKILFEKVDVTRNAAMPKRILMYRYITILFGIALFPMTSTFSKRMFQFLMGGFKDIFNK
jgi:hypothetical protein